MALRREEEQGRSGLTWQRQARCKGALAEAFFPPVRVETKDERDYREALAITPEWVLAKSRLQRVSAKRKAAATPAPPP